jgi:type I restriction enzyme S subunit
MKSGEGITSVSIDAASDFPCYGGNGLRGYTKTFTHDGNFVLVGRVGALCGNVLRVSGRFFASEHAIVVTPTKAADPDFLSFILARMNHNRLSESSAQPVLTVSKLLKLEVRHPPTAEEQGAIAAVLNAMDAELDAIDVRLNKTRALKQAMMQALLTGSVRLPVKRDAAPQMKEAVHA